MQLLAKWNPKKYGEKVTNEMTGANGTALFNDEDRAKRLAALAASMRQAKSDTDVDDLV